MATCTKRGNKWYFQVCVNGIRKSKSFSTKAEGNAWAAAFKADIDAGRTGKIARKQVRQLLEHYGDRVSPTKRGSVWEQRRIRIICEDPIADIWLADLSAEHIAAWRDRRLKKVTHETVRRDWNLMSHAFNIAVQEWKWLHTNPMKGVRRPKPGKPREKRYSQEEIERIIQASGYHPDQVPQTKTARVCAAFLYAIETGMRQGEIAALKPEDVFLQNRFVKVLGEEDGGGKTAAAARDVPLSTEAIRLLKQVMEATKGEKYVFGLSRDMISVLFRKIRIRADVSDGTFHDSRHEAISRLAKKMDVLALARMIGHKDLKQLLVYYNQSAEEIAAALD